MIKVFGKDKECSVSTTFGLVSLFNDISTFISYLMPKPSLSKTSDGTIKSISGGSVILTLDRAVNQRCTCVNKRKKKRKQVDVIKEYRQMPAAVELVGDRKARVRASLETDAEKVLSEFLKITQCVKRSWVNMAVFSCLHSFHTHHRSINPCENKMWEIRIFNVFRSSLSLIMFPLIFVYVCGYTTDWGVHNIHKDISPKVNVIARHGFGLT